MDVIVPFVEFLFLGVVVVQMCVRSTEPTEREWMRTLLLAALLLRLGAATAFALFPATRVFHDDATGYEVIGMLTASMWRGEYPPFPMGGTNSGFNYVAGTLNFLFGRYRPVLSYFNCIVGTLLVFFVFKLTQRFFHSRVARFAALLVGLMPSMILWSSIALKDMLATLLLVVALSSCVELRERVTVRAVLGTLLPVMAILSIRFYLTYFVGFAIVVSLVLERGGRFLTGIYKQIFLVLIAVGLLAVLGVTERTEQEMDLITLEKASAYRRGMAMSANSGFDLEADVSTPGNALLYLPFGMAYLLWAPFPWQMVSLRPLLAAPETIFWWFLFPATMRGLIFAVRNRFAETSALIIFSITLTCAYSLIHGNIGSAFRQRAQILVFLFIFSAAGIYIKRLKKAGMDPMLVLNRSVATESTTYPIEVSGPGEVALNHPSLAAGLAPIPAGRIPKA